MSEPARIALVTGGNSGIGFETVRALARHGMTVWLGSRDAGRGHEAAAQLAREGDVRFVHLDLLDAASLERAVRTIDSDSARLDVLVNNAGASFSGSVLDASQQDIRDSFETNLHGPMHLTRLCLPLLRKGSRQRIVNVGSRAGTFAFMALRPPASVPYAYCAAKAALHGATVMLAAALEQDGIKVNAASPGLVNSRVSRFHGTRGPADGARIVVELAMLDDDGPTGGFFGEEGPIDW